MGKTKAEIAAAKGGKITSIGGNNGGDGTLLDDPDGD